MKRSTREEHGGRDEDSPSGGNGLGQRNKRRNGGKRNKNGEGIKVERGEGEVVREERKTKEIKRWLRASWDVAHGSALRGEISVFPAGVRTLDSVL